MKKSVHVIHHTHWDFEWYFTTNESFVQFVYHMDEVIRALEKNQIQFYLLDGQMSILDDYLQSFPHQKKRLKHLVQQKRLKIGPWYTQTDELIVRGEAIVRNLNLGIKLANCLGGYMNLGYLPDSFGQSKDMPKIYNGFGMRHAIFWRGVSEELIKDREFFWQAEDGSEVVVANIKNGYFIGVNLIYSNDYETLMSTINQGANEAHLILPVGGDQRYVDFNLRERITEYNRHLEHYHLMESTYEDFFSGLDETKLQTVSGEFISSAVSKIHRSIYSSRYDHKYLNDKIERRMIYQLEPLMVLADQLGIPYKEGLLERIWKLLAKNQAHDSAGGCNSDKTNRIILERFIEADQLSYSAMDYLIRKMAESRGNRQENEFTIFNSLPWEVNKVVKCQLATTTQNFTILKQGLNLPFEILSSKKEYAGTIRRFEKDQEKHKFYFVHELVVEVNLPALNFVTYQIQEGTQAKSPLENAKSATIENERYQVSFLDGQLHLLDKGTNTWYKDIISFEDSGDEGDTYDYSPPYRDDRYLLDLQEASSDVRSGKLLCLMKLTGTWQIAKNLQERKEKHKTQSLDYAFTIRLAKGAQVIDFHLEIENKAYDHRMRVLVRTPFTNHCSYADTSFGTVQRPVEDPHLEDWKSLGWREEPTAIFPMIHYVNTHCAGNSWTVFTKGMKEYQLIGEGFTQIALTLFRSVSYLGRPDLLRRPGVASGNAFKYIATPDSQLIRKMKFKFALRLDPNYDAAALSKAYLDYAIACPFYQLQELNRFTTALKYFVSHRMDEQIEAKSFLQWACPNLVFSSLRKSCHSSGFELRVYNPSLTDRVSAQVLTCPDAVTYEFVDLKGTPITIRKTGVKIDLEAFKPGEIKTIHIEN